MQVGAPAGKHLSPPPENLDVKYFFMFKLAK